MDSSSSAHSTRVLGDILENVINRIANDYAYDGYDIAIKQQSFTGDNFLGDMSRVKITPLKDNKKPLSLIIKKGVTNQSTRETADVNKFYVKEIYVYTNILPAFYKLQEQNNIPTNERFAFAKFYEGISKELEEFIILKDLCADGFVMRDKKTPYNFEEVSLLVKNLARLHAASFALKHKNPELYAELSANVERTVNYGDNMVKLYHTICETFVKCIGPTNKTVEEFVKNMKDILYDCLDANLTEPYNIICHGDCWTNNMLFKYQEGKPVDVVLVDWQMIRFASPVTDLSYAISSVEPKILNDHLQEIFELYYGTLTRNLSVMGCDIKECLPRSVFEDHVKQLMKFGLIFAFMGIPMSLNDSSGARQIGDIVDDLNTETARFNVTELAVDKMNKLFHFFIANKFI